MRIWPDGIFGSDSRSPQRAAPRETVVKGDGHRHKFPSTWVQMAIIAMNSASEASAAASWIRALNMGSLPGASNSNAGASVPVGT